MKFRNNGTTRGTTIGTTEQVKEQQENYTVVKWGHTEGIEREKTSSEKYTVISLDFWRDKLFLVFQIWGQNTFGG